MSYTYAYHYCKKVSTPKDFRISITSVLKFVFCQVSNSVSVTTTEKSVPYNWYNFKKLHYTKKI